MGTGGVEVAQKSAVPLLGLGLVAGLDRVVALSVDHVGNGVLDSELGVSVGVGGAERADLRDGDHVREASGIAVDGGGAGEDDVGDVVTDHGAEEADGAVDIDMVVVERLLAGFADSLGNQHVCSSNRNQATYLQSSEVNDTVDVGVGLKDLIESRLVGDIQLGELGLLARDQLNALQGLGGRVVQVISHDDLIASIEEGEGGEGANVARSTIWRGQPRSMEK